MTKAAFSIHAYPDRKPPIGGYVGARVGSVTAHSPETEHAALLRMVAHEATDLIDMLGLSEHTCERCNRRNV